MTGPFDTSLRAGSPAASRGEAGRGRQDFLASLFEIASALTSKEDLPGVLEIRTQRVVVRGRDHRRAGIVHRP